VTLAGCGGTVAPKQPTIADAQTTSTAAHASRPARAVKRPMAAVVSDALIQYANLGSTWSRESKAPRTVDCTAVQPWRSARVKRSTPIFRSNYVAIQEIVAAFPDAHAARRARLELGSAPGQRCFQRVMRKEGDAEMSSAHFQPVRIMRAETPLPGVEATRSVMTTRGGVPPGAVFIDEIRTRLGVYLADTVVVSSTNPLEGHVYNALIAVIDRRLRQAPT
jgi:hypothetical protein